MQCCVQACNSCELLDHQIGILGRTGRCFYLVHPSLYLTTLSISKLPITGANIDYLCCLLLLLDAEDHGAINISFLGVNLSCRKASGRIELIQLSFLLKP